jgi:hypothetical protein
MPCKNNYYLPPFKGVNENVSDKVLRRKFGPNHGNKWRMQNITK